MSDDNARHEGTTSADLSRPTATSDDNQYSLSIEDALARYEAAGIPRTRRSVQRYCAKGDLDAHRIEIPFGEKFLISPASVDRHIAYINEVRLVATGRDKPRLVATDVATKNQGEPMPFEQHGGDDQERQATTGGDASRLVAAENEPASRYVVRLEGENDFLRQQIEVKDEQIKAFTAGAHETNVLIAGLQKMLTPLLNAPHRPRTFVEEPEQP